VIVFANPSTIEWLIGQLQIAGLSLEQIRHPGKSLLFSRWRIGLLTIEELLDLLIASTQD